jgi:uncharacterized membrane protein
MVDCIAATIISVIVLFTIMIMIGNSLYAIPVLAFAFIIMFMLYFFLSFDKNPISRRIIQKVKKHFDTAER